MKPWQYNVMFFIATGGAVFLLFAKNLGVDLSGTALTGYGAILTYVLTEHLTKPTRRDRRNPTHKKDDDSEPEDGEE